MVRVRSRISLSRPDDKRLALQSNVGRRILFGAIGMLLLISFLVGVDWRNDFQNGMVAGTIFYFVITAICLAVAGWNSLLVLDHRDRKAYSIRKLFGLKLSQAALELSEVKTIVIQGVKFLRENEQPRPSLLTGRLRGYVERRNVYYKLYLETGEKLHFVEDSTDLTDLEVAAQSMANFLGVGYRREEL